MCPFCRKEEEELEHILIHYHAIWGQWTDLLLAFGVDWTCPFLAKDIIQNWIHFPIRKKAKAIWKAAPLLLFWAIWKERNIIIFKDAIFPPLILKLTVIRSLFTWGGFISKVDIEFVRLLRFRFYGYAQDVVFLGWFVCLFLLSLPFSFCLDFCGLSCIRPVCSLFWSIYRSLSIKKIYILLTYCYGIFLLRRSFGWLYTSCILCSFVL